MSTADNLKVKVSVGAGKPVTARKVRSFAEFKAKIETLKLSEEIRAEICKYASRYPEGSLDYLWANIPQTIAICQNRIAKRNVEKLREEGFQFIAENVNVTEVKREVVGTRPLPDLPRKRAVENLKPRTEIWIGEDEEAIRETNLKIPPKIEPRQETPEERTARHFAGVNIPGIVQAPVNTNSGETPEQRMARHLREANIKDFD